MIRRFVHSAFCWVFLLWSALGSISFADYIYIEGPSNINVNTSFTFDIYLVSSNPVLADPNFGIISGSFGVEIVSGTSTLTQVNGNSAFDSYPGPVTTSPWHLSQTDLDPNNGTPYGSAFGTNYRFKLGTFEGMSSSTAETALFRVIDLDISADDIVLGDGTVLDSSVFPSADFTLNVLGSPSAVPEPSSLALLAIGATATGLRYARRRFTKRFAK